MSQGKLGLTDSSDQVDFEIQEDELSQIIRESGLEMLNESAPTESSKSSKSVESITKLSESLNKKVSLRFRLAETSKVTKKTKANSLTGVKPNLSTTHLVDKFNVLKQENEKNRVKAKWFGKSNFEKDITIPLSCFLDKCTTNIRDKVSLPPTVFKEDFLPLHQKITQEINEQKEKERSAKPKEAEPHRLKKECAENLLEVLTEGFRLWRNLDEEISKNMVASLEASGHLDYIRSLGTDPNKFIQEKENLNKFLSAIEPKRIGALFKAVIDPKKGIESPDLAVTIMDRLGIYNPSEILEYLKPHPKVLTEVILGSFKAVLEKQELKTFLRDNPPAIKSVGFLLHDGPLKNFHVDTMKSLNGDVLELAKFKIDPKKPIDKNTQEAYSKFLNKVADKITANSLPNTLLSCCKEIYSTYLKLSNDQRAAADNMVTFLVLRVYTPMVCVDFPKLFAELEKQAIAKKQDATELKNQKEAFDSHYVLLAKVLQNAGNSTEIKEQNLIVLNPLIRSLTQRFVGIANDILIRIQNEDLEELEELQDDEELEEIKDEDPLFEIVERDGREFVIGAITSSNPLLWIDLDEFGKRFCISTAKPKVQGNWGEGNQFCALMALKWLDKRPQTLKLGELGQEEQVIMASRLVDSTMEAQVNLAKVQLKSVSTKTLGQSDLPRKGALIWMGNDRHVMAAEILGNGKAKFYDPDVGTTETIAIEELKVRTSNCNTFVASA
jgi:hypothetical protein